MRRLFSLSSKLWILLLLGESVFVCKTNKIYWWNRYLGVCWKCLMTMVWNVFVPEENVSLQNICIFVHQSISIHSNRVSLNRPTFVRVSTIYIHCYVTLLTFTKHRRHCNKNWRFGIEEEPIDIHGMVIVIFYFCFCFLPHYYWSTILIYLN